MASLTKDEEMKTQKREQAFAAAMRRINGDDRTAGIEDDDTKKSQKRSLSEESSNDAASQHQEGATVSTQQLPATTWTCSRCTLINGSSALTCEVCTAPRPPSEPSSESSQKLAATKRTSAESILEPHYSNANSKRPRPSLVTKNNINNGGFMDSHIRLLRTDSDVAKLSYPIVAENCLTLRQALGFDSSCSYYTECSIDWMVISNFMVDVGYLLNVVLPELYSIPTCVVFYGQGVSPNHNVAMAQWKQATNVDFVELDPSAEPRSRKNPLKYKFPYGVHHTKMFLVGLSNGSLRVMIHTANLMQGDTRVKTQGAYIQDFPLKTPGSMETCEFENDLIDYVQTYGYETPKQWSKDAGSNTTLCQQLRRYDFTSAKVVLIASTPGYHSVTAEQNKPIRGYLKLSKAIHDHCPPAVSTEPQPVVCQFSSMGSLSPKWLKQFVSALDASQRPCSHLDASTLKLVFPTAEEIRTSVEGYAGGGSVPSAAKNVDKDFLQPLYHKWSSSTAQPSCLLHKPQNVPHIKTFFQPTITSSNDQGGDCGMQWFCVTSHNLSTSAWGQVQKSKKYGGQTCFIRHWELGVFVAPSMFGEDVQMRAITEVATKDAKNQQQQVVGIPLPYPIQPTKYGQQDEVFSWEKTYATSDAFGKRSTMCY